jgi:hypothetical protein
MAADRAGSLPGRGHREIIIVMPRSPAGSADRLPGVRFWIFRAYFSQEYPIGSPSPGHFWKAAVGNFWRAPKDVASRHRSTPVRPMRLSHFSKSALRAAGKGAVRSAIGQCRKWTETRRQQGPLSDAEINDI